MKVFISHSSKDKKFVRKVKSNLMENCIDVWIDEDQLDLGDSLMEKLEIALKESSHFVIILSPSAVNSDWVKLELKKALKHSKTGLVSKIIPVKYRDCEIPLELSDNVYADLTEEVVIVEGDEVKFISKGFDDFFLKLVRAIKNSSRVITAEEKTEIKKSLKEAEEDVIENSENKQRAAYKLIGYATKEIRERFEKVITKSESGSLTDEVRPILLPPSIKGIWKPEIGEKIKIEAPPWFESYGHFAGFRKDDLCITMSKRTREEASVEVGSYYEMEIDKENKKVKFYDKITK